MPSIPIRRFALIGSLAVLVACTTLERTHGYVPQDSDLDAVVVGRDTKSTVRTIIGAPGATGLVSQDAWYYVRSSYERNGARAPEEVDREVLAVSFDGDGVVTNIERFGLEDGQVVALSRRVTDANTQGIGFLRQLFGNLGRIDPGRLLGGS